MPRPSLILILVCSVFPACATLMAPKTSPVSVSSEPAAGDLYVDGSRHGSTPDTVELTPNTEHTITVRKGGYEAATCTVKPTIEASRALLGLAGPTLAIAIGAAVASSAAGNGNSTAPGLVIAGAGLVSLIVDGATRAFLGPDRKSCSVTLPPERSSQPSGGL